MKHELYEEYFNNLGISKKEAKALIDYLQSLAEIGVRFVNEHKIEDYEKCSNMDESVNQTSGR